jgi:predicted ester cyclase
VAVVSNLERNKSLVRMFFDLLDSSKLSELDRVLDKRVVWHGTGGIGTITGIENYRDAARPVIKAFPDAKTIVDLMVAEGELVAVRYTVSATHRSEFIGFEPTGKKIILSGNSILRIENDRIVEIWHGADLMGLLIANSTAASLHGDRSP